MELLTKEDLESAFDMNLLASSSMKYLVFFDANRISVGWGTMEKFLSRFKYAELFNTNNKLGSDSKRDTRADFAENKYYFVS